MKGMIRECESQANTNKARAKLKKLNSQSEVMSNFASLFAVYAIKAVT